MDPVLGSSIGAESVPSYDGLPQPIDSIFNQNRPNNKQLVYLFLYIA